MPLRILVDGQVWGAEEIRHLKEQNQHLINEIATLQGQTAALESKLTEEKRRTAEAVSDRENELRTMRAVAEFFVGRSRGDLQVIMQFFADLVTLRLGFTRPADNQGSAFSHFHFDEIRKEFLAKAKKLADGRVRDQELTNDHHHEQHRITRGSARDRRGSRRDHDACTASGAPRDKAPAAHIAAQASEINDMRETNQRLVKIHSDTVSTVQRVHLEFNKMACRTAPSKSGSAPARDVRQRVPEG